MNSFSNNSRIKNTFPSAGEIIRSSPFGVFLSGSLKKKSVNPLISMASKNVNALSATGLIKSEIINRAMENRMRG